MIKRDPSPVSGILITCTDCPWWYAFRSILMDAYICGEDHEIRVHRRDPRKASQARRRQASRARHAVHS